MVQDAIAESSASGLRDFYGPCRTVFLPRPLDGRAPFSYGSHISESAVAITNLLYRYCELMDSGALGEAAALFRHARIKVAGLRGLARQGRAARSLAQIRPDLPVRHAAHQAHCQQPDHRDRRAGEPGGGSLLLLRVPGDRRSAAAADCGRPLLRRVERVEGVWRFSYRDYSMLDLKGNLEHHLKLPA